MFNPSSSSKTGWWCRCWRWRGVVVIPASGIGPSSYGLGAPAIHLTSSCSSAWGGCSVVHRPCPCRSPPRCSRRRPFLPVVVPVPIVVVVVVVGGGGLLLAWCSPMSSLASNTHDTPCEQLLAGVRAGAGSSVVVGVFCGCLSLVALALGSWSSPFLLSPLPFVVIAVPPAFHPPSSCSWGWGRVVCRSSP
jgi:hypothetical protein